MGIFTEETLSRDFLSGPNGCTEEKICGAGLNQLRTFYRAQKIFRVLWKNGEEMCAELNCDGQINAIIAAFQK